MIGRKAKYDAGHGAHNDVLLRDPSRSWSSSYVAKIIPGIFRIRFC